MTNINKIHHSGLINKKEMSIGFDNKLSKISDVKEILIHEGTPNLRNEFGEPLWLITMKSKNQEGLKLLLSNNVDVSIRDKFKTSWTLSCFKYEIPQSIFILGLNKDNENWFSNNINNESPFFFENIVPRQAEIISLKYWSELRDWSDLRNKDNLSPVAFFEKIGKFKIAQIYRNWLDLSIRG